MLLRLIVCLAIAGAVSLFAFEISDKGFSCRRPTVETMVKGIFKGALQDYQKVCGRFPTSDQGLMALVEKPTHNPIPTNWNPQLSELPKDPWGNDYLYRFPGVHNADRYDLSSRGPDGIVDTDDDVTNWKK